MATPFNRKQVLSALDFLIEKGYGSFLELTELTIRDLSEILIIMDSKEKEAQVQGALSSM